MCTTRHMYNRMHAKCNLRRSQSCSLFKRGGKKAPVATEQGRGQLSRHTFERGPCRRKTCRRLALNKNGASQRDGATRRANTVVRKCHELVACAYMPARMMNVGGGRNCRAPAGVCGPGSPTSQYTITYTMTRMCTSQRVLQGVRRFNNILRTWGHVLLVVKLQSQ
jgi:hypothetical protein